MELRQSTLRRVAAAMRTGELGRCLSCGGSVKDGEPHVRLQGMVFHSACARYRRRWIS
jgi:translation initiation factor 1 (eIF-1/SUI1)